MKSMQALRAICRIAILVCGGWAFLNSSLFAQSTNPYQLPYTEAYTPLGNMLMLVSVEFPTGNTPAYDSTGGSFDPKKIYRGYFEPNFCYKYKPYSGSNNPTASEYFYPVRISNQDGVCGQAGEWSGNLLNWVSMGAPDSFRWVLTGGNRMAESLTETFLRRTWFDAREFRFNDRHLTSNIISSYTGLMPGNGWTIANADPEHYGQSGRAGSAPWVMVGDRFRAIMDGETIPVPYVAGSWVNQRDRYYRVVVKACSTPGLIESFCQQYPSGYYKPVGLMQKYADKARFGVFSYPNIDWCTFSIGECWKDYSDIYQAGGVMRSAMKSLANTEWDPQTGMLCSDPDNSLSCNAGSPAKSGSINYINQFGYNKNLNNWNYKYFDDVAELFYEGVRYFSSNYSAGAHGMAPSYKNWPGRVNLNTTDMRVTDGFPMILDNWKDPLIDKCSSNNMIFIGDVNTNCDGRIPGGVFSPYQTCVDKEQSNLDAPTGIIKGSTSSLNVTSMLTMMGGYEGLNLLTMDDSNPDWMNIFCPGGLRGCWKSGTLNIAGLAYWAHAADIRPDLQGNQYINSYFIDVHESIGRTQADPSIPFGKDPTAYWYAAKYGSYNTDIASRGGNVLNPNSKASLDSTGGNIVPAWDVDGDGIPDGFFEGSNPDSIKRSFGEILSRTTANTSQVTANVEAASTDWSSGNTLFFPFYQVLNGVWFGDLYGKLADVGQNQAFRDASGNLLVSAWSVRKQLDGYFSDVLNANNTIQKPGAEKIGTAGRQIIAGHFSGEGSVAFHWDQLDTNDQALLGIDSLELGAKSVDYIRGDARQEIRFGGAFRDRPFGRMGGIINAAPVFVGRPQEGYSDSDFPKGTPSFAQFVQQPRTGVVYVGADDGMLHGFNASNGVELFAYIPGMLMGSLPELTKGPGDYVHHLFVDGNSMAENIMSNDAWKTALIGTLGGGGRGFYILDITDPSQFTHAEAHPNTIIKLEVSALQRPEVGYMFNQSVRNQRNRTSYAIGRIKWSDDQLHWVAFLGNGIGAQDKKGISYVSLLVVDLDGAFNGDGHWNPNLVSVISVPSGAWDSTKPNGLSTPTAVDTNYDGLVDTVYAGDIQGNLWKFDLSKKDGKAWGLAQSTSGTVPLFRARMGTDYQPITTAPLVSRGCANLGLTISFGTGSVWDEASIRSTVQNTLYTVLDTTNNPWEPYQAVKKSQLVAQTLLSQTLGYRYSSNNDVNYPISPSDLVGKYGWYLNLASVGGAASERVINTPMLYNNNLVLATYIPKNASVDSCDSVGSGALMALQLCSGGHPAVPMFNTNGDSVVDDNDHGSGAGNFASGKVYSNPVTLGEILMRTLPAAPGKGSTIPTKQCELVNSQGSIDFACTPSTHKRMSWKEVRQYCVRGACDTK